MAEGLTLQRTPFNKAIHRPSLLLGADRELVLATGLAAAILVFVVLTVYSVLLGIGLWTLVTAILRLMAKRDPMTRQIYLRHIYYRAAYRATSSPWRDR
ncbi:type IV secretion system protein VirB3 [Pseudorhizobium tarimense]|uniref:Type IV secretion system protein VirB3 n=1 Tax=Pseudorhizobium tarimense TaxID=1079109 RepID=A0ABV2HBX9_9HYPH|nr:conjugal transfer protein TrbD [Pseudorhizobium tarimense]MCJ8521163.1 conjugal transfer protein TrbD [Pseudorhizobium tarimense]